MKAYLSFNVGEEYHRFLVGKSELIQVSELDTVRKDIEPVNLSAQVQ